MTNPLVTTDWLADHLDDPNVVLVDASWYMPATGRKGRAEYVESHLPGAVFFGIDDIVDKTTALPHMLPTPEDFAEAVGKLEGSRSLVSSNSCATTGAERKIKKLISILIATSFQYSSTNQT